MIKIEVDSDALGGREVGGGVLAAITRERRQQVRDLTHLTDLVHRAVNNAAAFQTRGSD